MAIRRTVTETMPDDHRMLAWIVAHGPSTVEGGPWLDGLRNGEGQR